MSSRAFTTQRFVCDRCGFVEEKPLEAQNFDWYEISYRKVFLGRDPIKLDICGKCITGLVDWLANKTK